MPPSPAEYPRTSVEHESSGWTAIHDQVPSTTLPAPLSPTSKQDGGDYPPPLISRRSVPLPALSASPIILNPLLAYTANTPFIAFNLSQSSSAATLSPSAAFNTLTGQDFWRQLPAMRPEGIGSMTIRLAGAADWRPIVIFPKSIYDSVVTVEDVLQALSRAFRVAVLRRQGQRDIYASSDNQRRRHSSIPWDYSSNHGESYRIWWGGLYACPNERDVWILHTRLHR